MSLSWSWMYRLAGLVIAAPLLVAAPPAIAQERLPWARDEAPRPITPYDEQRRDWDTQPPPSNWGAPAPREAAPSYGDPPPRSTYDRQASGRDDAYRAPPPPPQAPYGAAPYDRAPAYDRQPAYDRGPTPQYESPPPPRRADSERREGSFSAGEIRDAGHNFFGSLSQGLASVIEYAFKKQGRPNGYILGEDIGGAFVAGLRYGEGVLYTRDAGSQKVFWQGPSIGFDAGAEGSKVMVLVYNLRDPSEMYQRFGGIDGSAYVVGGAGLTFLNNNHVILAPIRTGIGLRLGANIGYLKYTRRPTWNPF